MDFQDTINLQTQLLDCELYRSKKLSVHLVRSDQTHGQVSGNKWFKLKYDLLAAKQQNCQKIISFGGAYSNHIHALAYAANILKIPVLAFIRGEWTQDNQTLKDAEAWGMKLKSLTREEYRNKSQPEFIANLKKNYPNSIIIPEGGSSVTALKGVAELMELIEAKLGPLDHLVAACGTGGTLAGLVCGAKSTQSILGIPVLKGASFLEDDIKHLLEKSTVATDCQWGLDLDGHYGGYGKVKNDHLLEMQKLEKQHAVSLEPVYTAKMWRRFDELVSSDYFNAGDQVALLHSGGLQGRRGFKL